MKINSAADSEQMQLGMFHQEQIEQQLIESHNAPTIVRSNSSSIHGSIAIQRELPVSAAKATKVQRVSLPHPILNTARIEGANHNSFEGKVLSNFSKASSQSSSHLTYI